MEEGERELWEKGVSKLSTLGEWRPEEASSGGASVTVPRALVVNGPPAQSA